ncbi:recombinase family protein [Geodermatophilus sp. SYSU D00815]
MQSDPGRAGIYCRISITKENRDKVGEQEAACRALAKRLGLTVAEDAIYADDGISASTFKDRPGWKQLLKDIRARKFDVLLAVEETRFTRQPLEKEELQIACADSGVTWHTLSEGATDPRTSGGLLMSSIRGILARQEGQLRSERVLRANTAKRARGEPTLGPRPFGFMPDRVTHHPTEAAELRWAYEHIMDGGTLYAIAKKWNTEGVKTASNYRKPGKANDTWSYAAVRQLLLRPRNAGIYMHRGVELDVPPRWEPIVSRDLFDTVGALLRDPDRRRTDRREPTWLLAGIALCGVCGAPMRSALGSSRGKRWPVYRCAKKGGIAPASGRHAAIKCEELDHLAREAVADFFLFAPSEERHVSDPEVAEVRRIRALLAQIGPQIDAAMREAVRGSSARRQAAARRQLDELEAEEAQLQAKLDEHVQASARAAMLAEATSALLPRGKRADFAAVAEHKRALMSRFDGLPLAQRRTLVRQLITVTVNPGRGSGRVDVVHVRAPWLSEGDDEMAAV